MPREDWKSSKRLMPLKHCRRITRVQRSPSREAGLAIEHLSSASSAARIGSRIAGLRSESEPYSLRPALEPKPRKEESMPKLDLTIPADALSDESQQEL